MGSITAMMLAGHAHPHHGGIVPSHALYLSENREPGWTLRALDGPEAVTWIPTIERMLEDGLLMAVALVFREPRLSELARPRGPGPLRMAADLGADDRDRLYAVLREWRGDGKIAIAALRGSTVLAQLPVLERFKMDVEVCVPVFARSSSPWRAAPEVWGSLGGESA